MNILLVSHSFAPMNKISSMRLMHWCKYWLKDGHCVTVLTTKKYGFDGDLSLAQLEHNNLKVVEVDYLPSSLSKKESSSVTNGTEGPGKGSGLARKAYVALRNALGTVIDIHDLWIPKAVTVGKRLVASNNYDLIVSSYAPQAAHIVASKLSRKSAIPWIADYRDLWALNHIGRPIFPFDKIEGMREKSTLKGKVSGVISVSDPLTKQQSEYLQVKGITVENGFDPDEYKVCANGQGFLVDNKINIVYAGSLYKGRRDPKPLINLISGGVLENCVVHFFGADPKAVDVEVDGERVLYHGQIAREKLFPILKAADVLLMLESPSPDAGGVLTGKLFEYFALERPILGVGVRSSSLLGEYIKRSGLGEAVGVEESKIIKFFEADAIEQRQVEREFVSGFDRQIQSRKVLEFAQELGR